MNLPVLAKEEVRGPVSSLDLSLLGTLCLVAYLMASKDGRWDVLCLGRWTQSWSACVVELISHCLAAAYFLMPGLSLIKSIPSQSTHWLGWVLPKHGLVNVLNITQLLRIYSNIISNRYSKVMFKIVVIRHLPSPAKCPMFPIPSRIFSSYSSLEACEVTI